MRQVLRTVDLPGIILFSGMLTSLLGFLLSLSGDALWILLPVAAVASVLLVLRERATSEPFLNIRMLAANRRLVRIYVQFATLNIVFYSIFFGLPLWFEQARGFDPGMSGLILLPFAGIGVITTPVAAGLIQRSGYRLSLVIGSVLLSAGTLLLLLFDQTTAIFVIVVVTALLGVPNAFSNLGLQTAIFVAAPAGQTGAAAGQFQTFRYIGSILSTSLLGVVFAGKVTSAGLHTVALIIFAISLGLLGSIVWERA